MNALVTQPAAAGTSALDRLAAGRALAARGLSLRWVTVAEALAFEDATLDDVAAAAGLTVDEVLAGLRAWAPGLDIAEIVEGHRRVRVEGPVFAPAELTEAVPTRGLHRRRFLTPAELTGAVR